MRRVRVRGADQVAHHLRAEVEGCHCLPQAPAACGRVPYLGHLRCWLGTSPPEVEKTPPQMSSPTPQARIGVVGVRKGRGSAGGGGGGA
jgi:hypothetical protein